MNKRKETRCFFRCHAGQCQAQVTAEEWEVFGSCSSFGRESVSRREEKHRERARERDGVGVGGRRGGEGAGPSKGRAAASWPPLHKSKI